MNDKYDFSCWVIKYNRISINGKSYQKDSLKNNDGMTTVPLLWNHDHSGSASVLGRALLENRDDGIYVYCTLFDGPCRETVMELLQDKGLLSISPFITQVAYIGDYIVHGFIREVSLVLERVDPDESYYPVLTKGEK